MPTCSDGNALSCSRGLAGSVAQGSAALAANALDFLADSVTYAVSPWGIGRSMRLHAGAALAKSASLVVLGLSALGFAVWRAVTGASGSGRDARPLARPSPAWSGRLIRRADPA